MGQLEVQWPPVRRSLTLRYARARRRVAEGEARDVISTRHSAAVLEAKDFLSRFESVIHRLNGPSRRQSVNSYSEEFLMIEIEALPGPGFFNKAWYKSALEKQNVKKNRYVNVLANEATRVVLQTSMGAPDGDSVGLIKSDYINANHVEGVAGQVRYIATQSPLPDTVADFWQMIWETRSGIILMLTELIEGGKKKGDLYWPEHDNQASRYHWVAVYGRFEVRQVSRPEYYPNGIAIRYFELRKFSYPTNEGPRFDGEPLSIVHVQYSQWPDHGVPSSAGTVLDLMDLIQQLMREANPLDDITHGGGTEPPFPIVVHCSAGIGRTGSFCAIDIALRRFRSHLGLAKKESDELTLRGVPPFAHNDLASIVRKLKQQRYGMVQTWQQYQFCFHAVHEGIRRLIETEEAILEEGKNQRRHAHESRFREWNYANPEKRFFEAITCEDDEDQIVAG
mmetsp:Transcript_9802/g.19970  ORF Transcript_9802/g.19970 Transcript_9802/m.19970 type:complete len:451 (+) Transcript_9802:103-1455(+)